MRRSLGIIVAGLLLLAPAGWYAYHAVIKPHEKIDVGGISMGMTVDEYRASNLAYPVEIAGVTGSPQAAFIQGKLNYYEWKFANDKFDAVRDALKARYPQMKCVRAKPGGPGTQEREVCSVASRLFLTQGHGDRWTSTIWHKGDGAVAGK
jgi:hypothetical protein